MRPQKLSEISTIKLRFGYASLWLLPHQTIRFDGQSFIVCGLNLITDREVRNKLRHIRPGDSAILLYEFVESLSRPSVSVAENATTIQKISRELEESKRTDFYFPSALRFIVLYIFLPCLLLTIVVWGAIYYLNPDMFR